MTREDVRHLLDSIGLLRHPCDLDLLLFFARHPRALLASEQLAMWLGYELQQLADSLEVLLEAGLLTRTQNPTHAARMYVFGTSDTTGGWLPSLLALASTREGRLAMLEELSRRAPKSTGGQLARATRDAAEGTGPRPLAVWADAGRDPGHQGGLRQVGRGRRGQ